MITINDSDFNLLVQFVRDKFGINLEHKRQLINARLAFDIERRGYSGFSCYLAEMLKNPDCDECRHMINRLSTNYTYFFRDSEFVERLFGTVLKDFSQRNSEHLRIWCSACSSGEEAYSIAMALELRRTISPSQFDYEITATDINTEMLETARAGRYAAENYMQIPERYRHFCIHHTPSSFDISDVIKQKIEFRYENLLDEPPQEDRRYDIIFCRNVMIYFTRELRSKIVIKLHSSLRSGGYLFTGVTESVDLERKYFRYIAPSFYQRY